ncbi:MAG: ABC transporter ATP-binding protein [Peptoniphilus duerdenii]|uniref:ABC transporter ATP-binding protein n=1 Tax=Peptoniphilus duerdenii TaxID=507750 RepID=UPI00254E9332|nr:ABC transporter ATP-binding protein [Peptoniphilus duerdenii]MDK8276073.1 ABC transporter ATP-binding protein [Peptoniphilus duerdenii]
MKKNKKSIDKSSLNDGKRILKYILHHNGSRFILVFFLIIISIISTVSFSLFLKTIIDNYITPMIGMTNPDFGPLLKVIIKMGVVFYAGVIANYIYQMIMVYVTEDTCYNLRQELFTHLETLPIKYFDKKSHGDVMSVFTNDIQAVEQAIANIPSVFSSILTVISIFIVMLIESRILSLIVVLCIVLMFVIMKSIGSKSSTFFMKQQKTLGEENGYIEEYIDGQKVVKVFSYEDKTVEEFKEINNRLYESTMYANRYSLFLMPITFFIFNFQYAIIAIVGGILAISETGGITVGMIATFLQLSRTLGGPMRNLSQMINQFLLALAGAGRLFELLDEVSEENKGHIKLVRVEKDGNKLKETKEKTCHWAWKDDRKEDPFTELKGEIIFEDVTFGYEENKPVLKNISLYAKPEQKIAFVGSTGAGKTTITNLVNRFYDIWDGKITFDGIDIKEIDKRDLRRSLGMVLQDTHLFTGSIKDNLRFGNPSATDEEVARGAKRTQAHHFITLLPEGYDTVISGTDTGLSEGQAQLLSIARAEIMGPPVLILDEATSSIDTRTEMLVQESMDKVMTGRTTFVIAHRLSTVRNSDAIMVLEHGEIIERGHHEDLMEENGVYANLYKGGLSEE